MFVLFLPLDSVATGLDNCTFHESVDLTHFETTRTLVVRPPEGEVHVNSCAFDCKANFGSGRSMHYFAGIFFFHPFKDVFTLLDCTFCRSWIFFFIQDRIH